MKNFLSCFLRSLTALLFCLLCGRVALAQTPTPTPTPFAVGDIFFDKGDADYESVKSAAKSQSTGTPYYKSNGLETRTYEGFFKAASDSSKLALLSDDGTSVWIDGTQVLGNAGQGQGFENFDSTFTALSATFKAGHIYNIRLVYTNTIHSNDADVDGVTLFAYDGGGEVLKSQLQLKLTASSNDICAGGWDENYNNGEGGYFYLSKETGAWIAHDESSDPHLTTLTAQIENYVSDNPDLSVKFHWVMLGGKDGAGLDETKTVPVDTNGKATLKIVSGDQLSQDTDSEGNQLFDYPVKVEATCVLGSETQIKSVDLNVLAPTLVNNYKNEDGQYVVMPDDVALLDLNPNSNEVLLQTVATWKKQPVLGHRIRWSIDAVYGKGGEPLEVSDRYGRMSGEISTTGSNGIASATFTKGRDYAQLDFSAEDNAYYTWGDDTTAVAQNSVVHRRIAVSLPPQGSPYCAPAGGPPYGPPAGKKRKRRKKTYATPPYSEYTYVHGPAGYDHPHGYPAPPELEDDELLANTLSIVLNGTGTSNPGLNGFAAETSAPGIVDQNHPPDRHGDPGQTGGWWFSQVVGNDPDSAGYHFADIEITRTKAGRTYTRRYGAAFDIVLNGYNVFAQEGRMTQFGPYVKRMRNLGIVAWHRGAGEPGSVENEMHCIDPAMPGIKSPLTTQINSFISYGAGSSGYAPEPTDPSSPFAITTGQISAVKNRSNNVKPLLEQSYSPYTELSWPPAQGPNP